MKVIDLKSAALELENLLDKYEWFRVVGVENNSLCAYVSKIDTEIMKLVPDVLYGYQVKIAYEAYLMCEEKYGKRMPNILDAIENIGYVDDYLTL